MLTVAQQARYSLVRFPHKNSKALELLLRAVLQQVAVSLLVRCLDRVLGGHGAGALNPWSGPGYAGQPPKTWMRLPLSFQPPLFLLASASLHLSLPSTLSRLTSASTGLHLKVGDKDASKGKGGCNSGATEVPISTRFQSNRTSKMALRSSSRQVLAQQAKAPCSHYSSAYRCRVSLRANLKINDQV